MRACPLPAGANARHATIVAVQALCARVRMLRTAANTPDVQFAEWWCVQRSASASRAPPLLCRTPWPIEDTALLLAGFSEPQASAFSLPRSLTTAVRSRLLDRSAFVRCLLMLQPTAADFAGWPAGPAADNDLNSKYWHDNALFSQVILRYSSPQVLMAPWRERKLHSTLLAAPSCQIIDNLTCAQTVVGYTWATANDFPGRDPISWAIDISPDCTTWITAYDVQTWQNIPATRGAWAGEWCVGHSWHCVCIVASGRGPQLFMAHRRFSESCAINPVPGCKGCGTNRPAPVTSRCTVCCGARMQRWPAPRWALGNNAVPVTSPGSCVQPRPFGDVTGITARCWRVRILRTAGASDVQFSEWTFLGQDGLPIPRTLIESTSSTGGVYSRHRTATVSASLRAAVRLHLTFPRTPSLGRHD
jgi:hypothetical protein